MSAVLLRLVQTFLRTGAQFVGIAHSVRSKQQQQQQRRVRTVAPFPQVQSHEQSENRIRTTCVAKAGSAGSAGNSNSASAGRDRVHGDAGGRTHRVAPNQAVSKGPSRSRAQAQQPGVRRVSLGQANHPGQDAQTTVRCPDEINRLVEGG